MAERSIVADELAALARAMMRQVAAGVLLTPDKSCALAKRLSDGHSVAFSHISLGKGRIQMVATNNAVAVKIRVNLPLSVSVH